MAITINAPRQDNSTSNRLRLLFYLSVVGYIAVILSSGKHVFGGLTHIQHDSHEETIDQPVLQHNRTTLFLSQSLSDASRSLASPQSTNHSQNPEQIAPSLDPPVERYKKDEKHKKRKTRRERAKEANDAWGPDYSEENATLLHADLKSFYTIEDPDDPPSLWDSHPNSKLPDWMKKYLRWHKNQREALEDKPLWMETEEEQLRKNETKEGVDYHLDPNRYLVMICLDTDHHCGGVSDRLKPLPLLLRAAYNSKRILLIHWSRPDKLQEFLLPPKGGFDWTVPKWMEDRIDFKHFSKVAFSARDLRGWTRTNVRLMGSRLQDYHGGMHAYDEQILPGEANFQHVFHEVWRFAFTPSPPVRQIIEQDMDRLGLVPGQYVSAHLRVLYAMEDRSEEVKRTWAENAVNCATELRPKHTIFLASDSMNATYYANTYVTRQGGKLRHRVPNPNPPLHMDKVDNWKTRKISDFYDSFIDVYVMASAGCLTYNKGGFGVLALMVSRNVDCGVRQDALDRPKIRNPCHWIDDPTKGTETTKDILALDLDASTGPIYVSESMVPFEPRGTTVFESLRQRHSVK